MAAFLITIFGEQFSGDKAWHCEGVRVCLQQWRQAMAADENTMFNIEQPSRLLARGLF